MKGRRLAIALILAVLAIAAGAWLLLRPPALPETPLIRALESVDPELVEDAAVVTGIFNRFIPPDTPLERKRDILAASGFTCEIRPAMVPGNREMSCRRDAGSDLFCTRDWRYFQYEARRTGWLDRPLAVKRERC